MRKLIYTRILPIIGVLLLGWGGTLIIENLEPDKEVAKKQPKRSGQENAVSAAGDGSALTARQSPPESSSESLPGPSQQSAIPNIAPNLAPQIQPKASTSENEAIPSFSRNGEQTADATYNPDKDFAQSQILVLEPSKDFAARAAKLGYQIIEQLNLDALGVTALRVRVPSGMKTDEALESLSNKFPDLIMDFDHNFEPSQDQSRPRSPRRRRETDQRPSALEQMAVRKAGKLSRARKSIGWENLPDTCGTGLRIGMIDTAVDKTHPALIGQRLTTRVTHDPRARSGPAEHGTSIAAMFIGKPGPEGWGGLVPGAELMAANIFEVAASGKSLGRASSLLKGINWLARKKVDVVNIGLTGANNKTVRKAMFIAKNNGMIVVAAAGNRGWKKRRAYPAGYTDISSVTAVGPYRGVMKNANRGNYIDFAAPGVRIWTAVPGGGKYKSGSSYATTYITTLIGLEILHGRRRNPASLRDILSKEIIDLGKPGRDDIYGWGFIRKYPKC